MLSLIEAEKSNPDEWAARCRHWEQAAEAEKPARKRRQKQSAPLIITGYGFVISVEKKRLMIRGGITHYPQKVSEQVFYKGSLDLPPRIIIVDGKGTISIDALDWLAEQGVPLIRVRWNGQFFSLVTSGGCASDPEKFAWQVRAREDEAKQLAFYTPLMQAKFENALITVEGYLPESRQRERTVVRLEKAINRLSDDPPATLKALLGMEAQAASAYFLAWQALEIRWSKSKRYPVPESWHRFASRSSEVVGLSGNGDNVHASHPINAMLNYAYTVLLGKMQLQAISDGYDPMLGVIHTSRRSRYGPPRPSFALDLMEPHRPVVDRRILKLIREETFSGADFDLQSDGVVRVGPGLVRKLVGVISNAF